MKKILLSSLLIILVPSLMFLPVYLLMLHTANTSLEDYSDDVLGKWSAFQYYYESERFVCDDEHSMTLEITDSDLVLDGNILPPVKAPYVWQSGSAVSFDSQGKETTFFFSFDSHGNLKISLEGTSYIILLRKMEG